MSAQMIGISFREVMSGGFVLGETDPAAGEKRGHAEGSEMTMHAAIDIQDIEGVIRCDGDHLRRTPWVGLSNAVGRCDQRVEQRRRIAPGTYRPPPGDLNVCGKQRIISKAGGPVQKLSGLLRLPGQPRSLPGPQ
jgi:hypothetical protein